MNHFAAIVFKCLQLFDHCFDGVCLDRLECTREVVLFLLFHSLSVNNFIHIPQYLLDYRPELRSRPEELLEVLRHPVSRAADDQKSSVIAETGRQRVHPQLRLPRIVQTHKVAYVLSRIPQILLKVILQTPLLLFCQCYHSLTSYASVIPRGICTHAPVSLSLVYALRNVLDTCG